MAPVRVRSLQPQGRGCLAQTGEALKDVGGWGIMNILLVEDDLTMGAVVQDFLEGQDFSVLQVPSLADARQMVQDNTYDLIILDWDLPDGAGVDFCREIREEGATMPILFTTGRTDVDDKQLGFDAGADDYITKPYSMKELGMRVKAMIRRNTDYAATSAGDLKVGATIAKRYKLLKQIGEGGMAVVWLAQDLSVNRQVVVKTMLSHLLSRESLKKRFEQEYELLAKLRHPNIVTLHDAGALNDKVPYIVMEYVQGSSLRDLLEGGPLPLKVALKCLIQCCEGLQEAHDLGIVHRDLKPENIILHDRIDRLDAVKIVDFGIARMIESEERLTSPDSVIGTVEYLSPEQLNDEPLDGRCDVYALGVVMFELLTNDIPFSAESAEALISKILMSDPKVPSDVNWDLGPEVDTIVQKAVAKDRNLRYQSAYELKQDLEALLGSLAE